MQLRAVRRGRVSAGGVLLLLLIAIAGRAPARDCSVPEEASACATNDECVCGSAVGSEGCTVAGGECAFVTSACGSYCSPGGALVPVCRAGHCVRARVVDCAGDCDADAVVAVNELLIGVGIDLGMHPALACANLDGNFDGAVTVDEILRAVRNALDGCIATALRPPGLRGFYDTDLTTSGGHVGALGQVSATDDGLELWIAQGPNRSVYLTGPLVGSALTLSGDYTQTDVIQQIHGEATLTTTGGEEVITGTIEPDIFFDPPSAFVLRRNAAESPLALAGDHVFHFDRSPRGNGQPSQATIALTIAPDGLAYSSEAEDRGSGGELFGTITTGLCRIAPRGSLWCSMTYLLADSELTTPLRLTGVLASGGGAGEFLSGVDPPFGPQPYVHAAWTGE